MGTSKRQICNVGAAQTFQNPLIKEYTLNHIRDPTNMIYGIFLN